ncbi:MAG: hypothetical protein U5M51_01230 [Emticicia sp.]|nr:hypothetical protein [Emticicia sp.]
MIQDINFILLTFGLAVLLAVQLFALWKKKASKIKIGLNLLLWLSVCMLVINPSWNQSADTSKILVYSDEVSTENIQKTKDSLKVGEVFFQKDFNQRVHKNADFAANLGKIHFLGQDVSPEILSKLSRNSISWIPFFKTDELQDIRWNAVIRKGEMQEIAGKIELSEPKTIKIKFGNEVLDSLKLPKGFSSFSLKFPIFSLGRTSLNLALDQKLLQTVEFYSVKEQPKNILFILSNPDFESKTLADWLGKSGNKVEIQTTIAKNTLNKVSINQTKNFSPDIIITDPSNAENSLVKKAFSEGKSVLFINLENPDLAAKTINQNLGTKWKLKRTTTQENRPISQELTAQPYEFEANVWQKSMIDYPIAIQKKTGKVGINLLNETFPLMLSGDSLTYARIWQSTFQALNPSFDNNIEILAPIFQDVKKEIFLNSSNLPSKLSIEDDTIKTTQSAINSVSSKALYTFRKTGWQPFQDSLEVYVEENQSALSRANLLKPYLKSDTISAGLEQKLEVNLPEWAWFLIILLILVGLWGEAKV